MRSVFCALAVLSAVAAPAIADTTPPASETRPALTPADAEAQGLDLLANGGPSSLDEARQLLEFAAEAGRPEAMNALSYMLLQGMGGDADIERGRALLEQAAANGSVGANLTLSEAHIAGNGGYPRDVERGFAYALAAAESPLNVRAAAYAQWRVGMLVLQGMGVEADAAGAYRWVARSADNGSVSGMISRAVMLATGEGVAADPAQARIWYQRAAESGEVGSAHALRGLGGMLVFGEGGAVDLPRGYAYLTLARDAGDPIAARVLARVEGRMTEDARNAAAAIAEAFSRAHPVLLPSP